VSRPDLLIEEFHLSVYVPEGLRPAEYAAIRRTLDAARFRARLKRALRDVFRRYASLAKARVTLTR
jgi:hypothetical protein